MALVKGTLSRFVWKMFFYKGLNKKNFLLEALTVSDLQASLEAQAFKISLFKHFAVRNKYKRRTLELLCCQQTTTAGNLCSTAKHCIKGFCEAVKVLEALVLSAVSPENTVICCSKSFKSLWKPTLLKS